MQELEGYQFMRKVSLEKELKVIITKGQYDDLLTYFAHQGKSNKQINYYYFNPKISDLITVRIRDKNNKLFLQMKVPVTECDKKYEAVNIKKEFEKEIIDIPNLITKKQVYDLCGMLIGDFKLIGNLKTQRHKIKFDNCALFLDCNEYFDKIDYELEIEFQDEIPLNIFEILLIHNIQYSKKSEGKFSRFLKQYFELKKGE